MILVDDGSVSDKESMQRKYVPNLALPHKPKKPRSGSRKNLGLSAAKGKYIWFVDSDDYLKQGWQNAIMEAIQWVNADIIATPFDILVDNTEIVPQWLLDISEQGFYEYYSFPEAWVNVGNNYNYIFRLDNLINNNLFFESQLTLGEDAVSTCLHFWKAIRSLI